jgi:ribosome-binding protein aMBF1 (putative translation factor)
MMTDLKNIKTFDELLDLKYGKIGSPKRDQFHEDAKKYIIGEMIREARRQAKLTQAELASRTGTKKSYISRIENGKSDIQLSTFFKIIEEGLGRKVNLSIV